MDKYLTEGHSREYFGDYRDFWWNSDFIELMARRWRLSSASTMLDVGCGLCHWSLLLAPHLKNGVRVTAVDRDPEWAAGDPDIAKRFESFGASVEFMPGDAHALPFTDDRFDIVTCQTMLIHCGDPEAALREMRRVAKPGGIVICVEPNNLVGAASFDSVEEKADVDALVDNFREQLLYIRGRQAAGEGNLSLGDKLAFLFSSNGFQDIQSYMSDRVNPLYPPYDRPEQRAEIQQAREHALNQLLEPRQQQNRDYVAELNDEAARDFIDRRQKQPDSHAAAFLSAVDARMYYSSGLSVMYAVSGRK